ncbi:MAG TPA: hypothetical protein VIJ70_04385 [Gaiellaceae bacterium]
MEPIQPKWSSWSFLLYAGGLTVLAAALGWLAYLSTRYGDGAYAGWALLVLVVLKVAALSLRRRHRVVAGVFAFSTVVVFAVFVAALWTWFGWLGVSRTSPFAGVHVGQLTLELLTLAAALAALRAYRFALLVLPSSFVAWVFVTDLLSGGGDWSAVVTFLAGLVFVALAVSVDGGPRRAYGFWLHVASGLTIGGSLIHFLGHGRVGWALIAVGGALYVALSESLGRSSWAVLGAVGILLAAAHFAVSLAHVQVAILSSSPGVHGRGWAAPLVFLVAGSVLCVLGGVLARRATAALR